MKKAKAKNAKKRPGKKAVAAKEVSSTAIREEVISIVSNLAKIPRAKIEQCDKESFIDLGLDSFVLVEIVFSLENTFDVDIPQDSLPSGKNLDDLVLLIEKLIKKRG